MSEKIKKLGFELVSESQNEVTYKKKYDDSFIHAVVIAKAGEFQIFSFEDDWFEENRVIGLSIEEMEAFLEKMKEMRGAENDKL